MSREPLSSPESIDTALEALSEAPRREVLRSLSTPDGGPLAQDDLVGAAGQDRGIELVHVHLPKLDDEDFLEWDREAGELRPGPRFDEARPLLETIREHGRPDRD